MPKNLFSDADLQKTISYSCSTPQKHIIEEKKNTHLFLCIFTGPVPYFMTSLLPSYFLRKFFFCSLNRVGRLTVTN